VETSLHHQLKEIYAGKGARIEVPLKNYRIDVVCGKQLIEIQHGSLAAIRDKIQKLLTDHSVLVVKPLVVRKRLVKTNERGGPIVSRRLSPKRGDIFDLFDELVYFTHVFPHENLVLEAPLVEIEEWRYPGHGRRRRRRENDFQVEDQKLLNVERTYRFRTAQDLLQLIPKGLPKPFHTGHLAKLLGTDRWIAQRIAYCLREMGATKQKGKQGNAYLYEFSKKTKSRAA